MRRAFNLILAGLLPIAAWADCTLTNLNLTPLSDLGTGTYQGIQGGLYPFGLNTTPVSHLASGQAIGRFQVRPLDAAGNIDTNAGKIVLLSVGMSNVTREWETEGAAAFKPRADADPEKNPRVIIVDGAQGGQDATRWTNVNSLTWGVVDARLAAAGVTSNQVQVVWLKQAIAGVAQHGSAFPSHAQALQSMLEMIARNLKVRYPNVKICYVSSRTRAYTIDPATVNPEPFAYESGFATKWMVEDQLGGTNNLNFDPALGPVVSPWLAWGPYLWIDGTTPRSDGLQWLCSDLDVDFTHPNSNGVLKVSTQLLTFFKTNPTAAPWFLATPPAPDTSPPSVTVFSPTDGLTFTDATVTVTGNADDDTVLAGVTVLNTRGGSSPAIFAGNDWSAAGVPLHLGSNTLVAVGSDTDGNSATDTVIVVRDIAGYVDTTLRTVNANFTFGPNSDSFKISGVYNDIDLSSTDTVTVMVGSFQSSAANLKLISKHRRFIVEASGFRFTNDNPFLVSLLIDGVELGPDSLSLNPAGKVRWKYGAQLPAVDQFFLSKGRLSTNTFKLAGAVNVLTKPNPATDGVTLGIGEYDAPLTPSGWTHLAGNKYVYKSASAKMSLDFDAGRWSASGKNVDLRFLTNGLPAEIRLEIGNFAAAYRARLVAAGTRYRY